MKRIIGDFGIIKGEVLIAYTYEDLSRHGVVYGVEPLSYVLHCDL
jgi:hypothetical protein